MPNKCVLEIAFIISELQSKVGINLGYHILLVVVLVLLTFFVALTKRNVYSLQSGDDLQSLKYILLL